MAGLRRRFARRRSAQWRRRTVRAAGIGQVALLTVLLPQERRMRRTGGPGIIGFELAGNPERSQRIMARWGEEGRAAARASLLLDFPYLVTYAVLQSAACNSAGDALRRGGWPPLARWAPLIARAQFAAAAFDATENLSLLGVLGNRSPRLPALARACAQAKFALLLVGWSYAAAGLVSHLSSR